MHEFLRVPYYAYIQDEVLFCTFCFSLVYTHVFIVTHLHLSMCLFSFCIVEHGWAFLVLVSFCCFFFCLMHPDYINIYDVERCLVPQWTDRTSSTPAI